MTDSFFTDPPLVLDPPIFFQSLKNENFLSDDNSRIDAPYEVSRPINAGGCAATACMWLLLWLWLFYSNENSHDNKSLIAGLAVGLIALLCIWEIVVLHNVRTLRRNLRDLEASGQLIYGKIVWLSTTCAGNWSSTLHTVCFRYEFTAPGSDDRKLQGEGRVNMINREPDGLDAKIGRRVAVYYLNDQFFVML